MRILASNGPLGSKVAQNAAALTAVIDTVDGTSMDIDDDIFDDDDFAIIEEECVKITTHGTTCTIVRAQDDKDGGDATAGDTHASGSFVRLREGTVILTHTFTPGTEWFEGIHVSGERTFWWALEIDGDITFPPREVGGKYGENLVDFLPFTRYQPSAGKVFKVIIWTTELRMFKSAMVC